MIRPAKSGDWFHIASGAEEAFQYTPLMGVFDREIWTASWKNFSLQPHALSFVQIDPDSGIPVGCIMGCMSQDPANGEICAVMMFWHVAPRFRGQGLKLLKVWSEAAKELGATRLTLNHLLDLSSERMERIYRRMGYLPIEKIYQKRI